MDEATPKVLHSGWLWKVAGYWAFEHRYWAELHAPDPAQGSEASARLVCFTCKNPREQLGEEQLHWHWDRGLQLAKCYKAQTREDGEQEGLVNPKRRHQDGGGVVDLRPGVARQSAQWKMSSKPKLSTPQPQPKPSTS